MILSGAAAARPGRGPFILLVDDHQDTRLMYAEFLGASFDVLTMPDASQALAAMRIQRPDLLVTDLSLPGMDGFELIATMRKDTNLRGVPIICLSGYGGHAHEIRAREAGCDRILQKPCMPDTLADIVTEVLQAFRDRRAES
jgi:DNA-binding response OmpR family regulator